MKSGFSKLGGVLGIVYCLGGFFLIFLGWNGAASNDAEAAQLPYVISGGLAGLGLIVVGAALIVANSMRTDRVALQAAIEDLRTGGSSSSNPSADAPVAAAADAGGEGSGDMVVAGSDSYHRPPCSLVQGQADQATMTRADARQSGRSACRVCNPDDDR